MDLRYACRTLVRNPGFAFAAILALALGIGANTAVFSVVNGVLLRPLPYADPDRLVVIYNSWSQHEVSYWPSSVADFLDWKSRSRSFATLDAYSANRFTMTGGGEAEQIVGTNVTATFFETLGAKPMIGRTFAAGEDEPNRTLTAVLSERLWRRRFGGSPDVAGKIIELNGRPHTVIGVMPASFQFQQRDAEVWPILVLNPPTRRGPFFLRGLARLKPGVTAEQAMADLGVIASDLARTDPKGSAHLRYPVVSLRDRIVGDIRPLLLVLMGAVALVLLIAVSNVANLTLARATVRQREIAIRLSIGAGRAQLVRQLLTESILLSLAGVAAGVLLAAAGVSALWSIAPPGLPRIDEIVIDGGVLGFTLLVSVVCATLFGLAPALAASRGDLSGSLKEGARGGSEARGSRRTRGALVVAQVALSMLLLTDAGLLLRSFSLLGRVPPGFQAPPERLLTMLISPTSARYRNPDALRGYWDQLIDRVRALPGVEAASIAITLPPDRTAFTDGFEIPGRTPSSGGPVVPVPFVSADYFKTMGIPLLRGRWFDQRDTPASPRVTIISETIARRYFRGEDPIGQRLKHGGPSLNNAPMEIVGVVGDVKYQGLENEYEAVYYEATSQGAMRPMWLVVRTHGDAMALAPAVRNEMRQLDADVPAARVSSMAEAVSESMALPRFRSLLMGVFAAAALLLAAVGIYGVIAYSVTRRTQEIGIRMALGATAPGVLRLVVGQGTNLALFGIGIGLAGALAVSRVLQKMLFGISATDPLTYAAVAVVLAGVALLASFIPARRAAAIDPLVALRHE